MFANSVICIILVLYLVIDTVQPYNWGPSNLSKWNREQEQKRQEDQERQQWSEKLQRDVQESVAHIRESTQAMQQAENLVNSVDLSEVQRMMEYMPKQEEPIVHKPLAFTSEELENFTFGPNDGFGFDFELRDTIRFMQKMQRATKRRQQRRNKNSTENESVTDNNKS